VFPDRQADARRENWDGLVENQFHGNQRWHNEAGYCLLKKRQVRAIRPSLFVNAALADAGSAAFVNDKGALLAQSVEFARA
jgi:hypothetical protein